MALQKVWMVLLTVLLQFSIAFADPMVGVDHHTLIGTTAEIITLGWDECSTATGYEIRAFHHEQEIYIWVGDTTELTFTYQLPKSGHYTFMVRAVNSSGESNWSESTDPNVAVVEGQSRAWWVYGFVAPPGPIIIE